MVDDLVLTKEEEDEPATETVMEEGRRANHKH